jgi:hypothetical protein
VPLVASRSIAQPPSMNGWPTLAPVEGVSSDITGSPATRTVTSAYRELLNVPATVLCA